VVCLWASQSGEALRVFREYPDLGYTGADPELRPTLTPLPPVRFAPDGRGFVAGVKRRSPLPKSADDQPRKYEDRLFAALWDAETGSVRRRLGDDESFETGDCSFSADGSLVAVVCGPSVAIWDTKKAVRKRRLMEFAEHPVTSLAFSPVERVLATGDNGGTIRLWSPEAGTVIGAVSAGRAQVGSLAYSGDGRLLASGDTEGWIAVWEARTGAKLLHFRAHAALVLLDLSPDGRLLASGSFDQTLKIWQLDEQPPAFVPRERPDTLPPTPEEIPKPPDLPP
jgi:WD40 repeat protein